jgi:hypothetical protein
MWLVTAMVLYRSLSLSYNTTVIHIHSVVTVCAAKLAIHCCYLATARWWLMLTIAVHVNKGATRSTIAVTTLVVHYVESHY